MPVQIHVGSNDGSNDLSRNRDFTKRYASNTELFVYPGAEHGFDRVATDITVRGTEGLVAGGSYRIKSDPASRELSVARVKQFFDLHLGK
jgi:dienelactone hydrolase